MIKAVGLLGLLAIGALTGALGAAWYVVPAGGSAEGVRSVRADAAAGEADALAIKVEQDSGDGRSGPDSDIADPRSHASTYDDKPGDPSGSRNFIAVGRQLIIPVVRGETTRALVLFELAVDVPSEMSDFTHRMLPRLRDAFLRELFAMSYTGAFDETYTDARIIEEMRRSLRVAARRILGNEVADVLVLDVMRQEL